MEKLQKIGTAEFYNSIAEVYDKQLEKGLLEKIIRKKFQDKLIKNFKPGNNILEISCGTGTDAVFLAKHGVYITAIDISSRMIEAANKKIESKNLDEFIKTFIMDAEKIGTDLNEKFDGVYSNFNGLNYISDFERFINDLKQSLNKHSVAQFTLLNKICLWEFIYFFLKFKYFTAFEFLRKRNKNYINEMKLYTPGTFVKFFKNDFKVKSITGFGLMIPPDGLPGLQKKFGWLFTKLEKLDVFISSIIPFRNFCDHYIVELEKR